MTNFEKIARSEESLAKFMHEVIWCSDCQKIKNCDECINHILNWLKQEDDYGLYNLPCK